MGKLTPAERRRVFLIQEHNRQATLARVSADPAAELDHGGPRRRQQRLLKTVLIFTLLSEDWPFTSSSSSTDLRLWSKRSCRGDSVSVWAAAVGRRADRARAASTSASSETRGPRARWLDRARGVARFRLFSRQLLHDPFTILIGGRGERDRVVENIVECHSPLSLSR